MMVSGKNLTYHLFLRKFIFRTSLYLRLKMKYYHCRMNEADRLKAPRDYKILDTGEQAFDDLTALRKRIFATLQLPSQPSGCSSAMVQVKVRLVSNDTEKIGVLHHAILQPDEY